MLTAFDGSSRASQCLRLVSGIRRICRGIRDKGFRDPVISGQPTDLCLYLVEMDLIVLLEITLLFKLSQIHK